jgi:phosphoribosylaminoimidazolecarboxamide formyltransferase / IMP cyclohydrolase
VQKRRALLSVYDKTGIVHFARGLVAAGFELVSSGGTSSALAEAGIEHLSVDDVTGFPEMLDGRVKTLHPRLHAGILADRSKLDHLETIAAHDIAPIDLVACNLYPFSSKPGIELIDVGGPSMVRAAAKNHSAVTVVVSPSDYDGIIKELTKDNNVSERTRQRLAAAAFAHTAEYDTTIAAWFAEQEAALNTETSNTQTSNTDASEATISNAIPPRLTFVAERANVLRYGENPHQQGARYRIVGESSWWDTAIQHGGKEMSYLNVYDTDAAWRLVHELGDTAAVAIIKHANPCGAAISATAAMAYRLAHRCDPVSAFGGIVAVNRQVSGELATELADVFTEVVVAPSFTAEALAILSTKKALRILEAPAPNQQLRMIRSIDGGLLVQDTDSVRFEVANRKGWEVVTKASPTDSQWNDLEFSWAICAHVSSNAIVLAGNGQAVGIGAGQQSRVDAAEIAVRKADGRAQGGVAASDAFFPFRDGLDLVAKAGVRAIIQPGGSVRDPEVIAAADEHGIALVFTGHRHFRH